MKSTVLTTGFAVHPLERLDLTAQLDVTTGRAALDPFTLGSDAYTQRVPILSSDFSLTDTASDLDVTRLDAQVGARYRLSGAAWLGGTYRYVDYDDEEPYLYDTSGRNHLFSLALGWTF